MTPAEWQTDRKEMEELLEGLEAIGAKAKTVNGIEALWLPAHLLTPDLRAKMEKHRDEIYMHYSLPVRGRIVELAPEPHDEPFRKHIRVFAEAPPSQLTELFNRLHKEHPEKVLAAEHYRNGNWDRFLGPTHTQEKTC
jgi:hypothetical protein